MRHTLRERFRDGWTVRKGDGRDGVPPGVALLTAFMIGLWTFLVVANLPVHVTVDGTPVTLDPSVTGWGGLPVLLVSVVGLLAAWGLLLRRSWGYVGTLLASFLGAILAFGATRTPRHPYREVWNAVLVALVAIVVYLLFRHEHVLSEWIADHDSR